MASAAYQALDVSSLSKGAHDSSPLTQGNGINEIGLKKAQKVQISCMRNNSNDHGPYSY